MNAIKIIMSWLEGLAEPDWQMYHSDGEVQFIAKETLALLEEQEEQIKNRDESLEVVRCKDCKNFDTYNVECMKSHFPNPPYDAWYCADGERKESGEVG